MLTSKIVTEIIENYSEFSGSPNSYNEFHQARSQVFSKGGAEVMEAKALTRKNCL